MGFKIKFCGHVDVCFNPVVVGWITLEVSASVILTRLYFVFRQVV